jgi:hypothetical protein
MIAQPVPTTSGELLFQQYLDAMKYPYEFEKEFSGKSQRPDYTVTKDGVFLFDVKDFDPYMPAGFSQYDPYPRIREKIDQGRKKFKQFKEFSCSIVMKNNGNVFVHLDSTDIMLGSMYGDAGFSIPIDIGLGRCAGDIEPKFLHRGKMVRRAKIHNTTISALITLRHVPVGMHRFRQMVKKFPNISMDETLAAAAERFPNFEYGEKQLGVIVWENAFARIPLSRELFTGSFDQRWGCEDGQHCVVFTGEKLAALEIKSEEIPEN